MFCGITQRKVEQKGGGALVPNHLVLRSREQMFAMRPVGCDAATSAILIWFIHSKDALLSMARRKLGESCSPLSLMFSSFYIAPNRAPTRSSVRRVQFLVLDRWRSEMWVLLSSSMLLCVVLVQGASKSSRLPWPQC